MILFYQAFAIVAYYLPSFNKYHRGVIKKNPKQQVPEYMVALARLFSPPTE
jgi:hypothetical protein